MKKIDLIITGSLCILGVITALVGFAIQDKFYIAIGSCGLIGGLLHGNAMSQLRRKNDRNEKN